MKIYLLPSKIPPPPHPRLIQGKYILLIFLYIYIIQFNKTKNQIKYLKWKQSLKIKLSRPFPIISQTSMNSVDHSPLHSALMQNAGNTNGWWKSDLFVSTGITIHKHRRAASAANQDQWLCWGVSKLTLPSQQPRRLSQEDCWVNHLLFYQLSFRTYSKASMKQRKKSYNATQVLEVGLFVLHLSHWFYRSMQHCRNLQFAD